MLCPRPTIPYLNIIIHLSLTFCVVVDGAAHEAFVECRSVPYLQRNARLHEVIVQAVAVDRARLGMQRKTYW